jgi:nucleoside-diphosphate-sugar epimerase
MTTRVLVTGAAGAVGEEALNALLRRPDRYEVVALDLREWAVWRRLLPHRLAAQVIFGDLRDPEAVSRAVAGVDAVLHTAAVIPPRADREPALADAVNVQGTRCLLAALARLKRPVRLIYTSSVSVYGDRVSTPWIEVDDAIQPSPHDHYAETKVQAEALVRASALPWTILRLTGVLSHRMGMDPLMFHMPLETSFESVTARDTGYALVRALEVDGLVGRTFNLGGGERCRASYREYLDRHLSILGLGPRFFPDDAFAEGNFHCGYYKDTNELQQLLGFQRDSNEDWFRAVRARVNPVVPLLAQATRPLVRKLLLRHSEPLAARRTGDPAMLARFGIDA